MPQALNPVQSATADEIREAALQQFAKVGYEATTMRTIAGSVGIKAASLYNHFSSKEEILWDLTHTALVELVGHRDAAFAELPATAGASAHLEAFVRAHVGFHATHQDQAALVNGQLGSLSAAHFQKAVSRRDAYQNSLQLVIGGGVAGGDFAVPDLRMATFAILEMGMAVSLWYRKSGALAVNELCEVYVQLAQKILAPQPRVGGRVSQ